MTSLKFKLEKIAENQELIILPSLVFDFKKNIHNEFKLGDIYYDVEKNIFNIFFISSEQNLFLNFYFYEIKNKKDLVMESNKQQDNMKCKISKFEKNKNLAFIGNIYTDYQSFLIDSCNSCDSLYNPFTKDKDLFIRLAKIKLAYFFRLDFCHKRELINLKRKIIEIRRYLMDNENQTNDYYDMFLENLSFIYFQEDDTVFIETSIDSIFSINNTKQSFSIKFNEYGSLSIYDFLNKKYFPINPFMKNGDMIDNHPYKELDVLDMESLNSKYQFVPKDKECLYFISF